MGLMKAGWVELIKDCNLGSCVVDLEPLASVGGTVGGVVAFGLFSLVVFLALGLGPSPPRI
jgi:hypothetical protein